MYLQEDYKGAIDILDSISSFEQQYNIPENVESFYPIRIDERLKHNDTSGAEILFQEYGLRTT